MMTSWYFLTAGVWSSGKLTVFAFFLLIWGLISVRITQEDGNPPDHQGSSEGHKGAEGGVHSKELHDLKDCLRFPPPPRPNSDSLQLSLACGNQMVMVADYKLVLLIGVFATLCNSAVLSKYEPDAALKKEEEPKFPPIPYNFEFDTRDENGTTLFRRESQDRSGKVEGRYGYKDMFGTERIVEYIADENGYRAKIKTNEPGIAKKNSAGVEFYAGGSGQEAKRYYNAKQDEGFYVAEKEKKQVAERIDSDTPQQYSGIITRPSSLNSEHHLFPKKQDQFFRINQNLATEVRDENRAIPQEFFYTQSVPAISENKQHFGVINRQVAAIQYAVPQFQPQRVHIHRRLITVPLTHYN
ncbi:uncharacterized protein TNIN_401411 [Trichonephila inaurata madagascariensis]|uniref:Uncharacterized protein n=1 Tax=Trichonephila inaurata madagascariensis TaxID=2747483 RepID=A0A8X7CSI7_9ARAC|nr:uncharacterized protein TNIN_401411 [Trichonephila inaurata madagascariensis]